MANERLRVALLERGTSVAELAEAIAVDPKTVERWITKDRTPYRKHRYAVASFLEMDERYLWPEALTPQQVAAASESEIITVYPHRWAVPRDAWGRLFTQAEREIGVLVYSGIFIAQDTGIMRTFTEKAKAGIRVRILLGDPDALEAAQRGADGGVGEGMAAQTRMALTLYRPLRQIDGIEIRLHHTILYNSIYRGDDQLLVNAHVYGKFAADAPVMHLRKVLGGDMVSTYMESFENVWAGATLAGS
ncbi:MULTISPECIES: helix-turn-helix domain-containing protein [Streptosporangium]|uniref:Lambda repressor-like predicted transcriptional regulator n=1 Tax=Streptosporangium brasiliense TaxID=47480 RepID=A0ABT9R6J1_9ACTN|nr:helix-turn-helix transcriptional regulator [Streptosporangium brasiliense]MDP9864866.1 lambda repressor-like predicted transcriptional regulator [Streptosporangium brasiliense]